MTEIKTSTILGAGRGVFATKHYAPMDYVCYYDAEESAVTGPDPTYQITLPDGKVMVGYKTPRTQEGVGQLINDGSMIDNDDMSNDLSLLIVDLERYQIESQAKKNMAAIGLKCIAVKEIKPGDELFFSYGFGYWAGRRMDRFKFEAEPYRKWLMSNDISAEDVDTRVIIQYLKCLQMKMVSW